MSSPRYRLGIDLGTTYTAAAVSRPTGGSGAAATWGEPEIVALGNRAASISSVLHLGADGTVLVGEAAERRARTEPERVVRQFKRRIGDDVPLVVGDSVHTAQELAARLARWVTDKVAEREGGPAETIAVTHPASWGEHRRELLAAALRDVGLTATTFLPEPQAAAVAYAAKERVDAGGAVAVYDLGGGTFDAAVVRRAGSGFELPGNPEGIEQLGGVDFDDRVFDHVRAGVGAAFDELDPEDPEVESAISRLRHECVEAKEALSFDTEVTIPVLLPTVRTNVRLTRHEFESMIRSSLDHTVSALGRTVESAGLAAADLQAVLLVGGSSRIPLVAQMVSEELDRPVAVDADPKTSIAVGAVLTIAPRPVASQPSRSAPSGRSAAAAAVGAGAANAATAAAVTSTLAGAAGVAAPRSSSSPSSGLLDLRAAASAAPANTPAHTPTPSRPTRTGPPSGRLPVTGPGSARFPSPSTSGRLPAAPNVRRDEGSGYFPAPGRPARHTGPHTAAGEAVTSLTPGGRTPPRPPTTPPAPWQEAPAPAEAPRSRTRLVITVAAAVALVAALTTGGVVYARNASVSATVTPPPEAPTSSQVVPAPVEPTDAAVAGDPASGTGSGSRSGGGGSASGGSRGGSSSGGSSNGGSGGGGHHGSGTTTDPKPTEEPWPTTEPTPEPGSEGS
ncbi:Hsp70 family protein [Actinomycetospora sp. OC33-EN08]|uniref:Hsp70 family protein n=1 Tax=Actinomycetospora aurantiaca TaxID=3129233 RepID=A0ABU8MRZ4_9PSEU